MKESGNRKAKPFFIAERVSVSWKIPLKDRIQFILDMKGMIQQELADLIGVNKGTMSKIINGLWIPTAKIKLLMGKHLGVDSLVLFGDQKYFLDYQETIKTNKEKNQDG
jgi:transcriptional regulator with XRE-family HTH domain